MIVLRGKAKRAPSWVPPSSCKENTEQRIMNILQLHNKGEVNVVSHIVAFSVSMGSRIVLVKSKGLGVWPNCKLFLGGEA